MSNFFNEKTLNAIKSNEANPEKIKNFFSDDFCLNLLDYRKSLSKKMVDREESTKIPFVFDESSVTKKLKEKIEEKVGNFLVKDFEPHFITTRFPLRLHADTGKDPNDIIFKNIVVPLQIKYKDEESRKNKSHTVIFKNKWYDKSALFTTKTSEKYDFIIKNIKEEFIDILNILDFKKSVDKASNEKINYKGDEFYVDENFKKYVDTLSKTKRYNDRTDGHITNSQNINKEIYQKYLTHQPYEDCRSLILDKAISWEPGSLIYWDRVRIHASDNFLKNGIIAKTCIALFTSK